MPLTYSRSTSRSSAGRTSAILVLSKASAWFEVGVTVDGGVRSSICGPYHEKEEDRLGILVRLTMSLACLACGLMAASAVTGAYASNFNQSIGAWKIDNVTNMRYMFYSIGLQSLISLHFYYSDYKSYNFLF